MMKTVCIFCGSGSGNRTEYTTLARKLAKRLVEKNIAIVYGGSESGLMGEVANTAMHHGGTVIGVITKKLLAINGNQNVTHLEIVETMHERKRRFSELCDGYIALPGGFGTFEEILEAITWNQLGIHERPTGLLNVNGFFNHLIELINHAKEEGFIKSSNARSVLVSSDVETLLSKMPMLSK